MIAKRLTLCSALIMMAIAVAAPASYSAEWYVKELKEGNGLGEERPREFYSLGFVGFDSIESKIGGTLYEILCYNSSATGTLESAGKSKRTIRLDPCAIGEYNGTGEGRPIPRCIVEEIRLNFKGNITTLGPFSEEWEGATNKIAGTISISGSSCPLNGVYTVTVGKQICSYTFSDAINHYVHVLDCNPGGSTEAMLEKSGSAEPLKLFYSEVAYIFVPFLGYLPWGAK